MNKPLTVADLIARKDEIKGRKKTSAKLFIESLGAEITISELPEAIVGEAVQMEEDSDEYAVLYGVSEPSLRDPDLQKAYGCVKPTDIVSELFKPGEIRAISAELMKLSGYGDNAVRRVDTNLKN